MLQSVQQFVMLQSVQQFVPSYSEPEQPSLPEMNLLQSNSSV